MKKLLLALTLFLSLNGVAFSEHEHYFFGINDSALPAETSFTSIPLTTIVNKGWENSGTGLSNSHGGVYQVVITAQAGVSMGSTSSTIIRAYDSTAGSEIPWSATASLIQGSSNPFSLYSMTATFLMHYKENHVIEFQYENFNGGFLYSNWVDLQVPTFAVTIIPIK